MLELSIIVSCLIINSILAGTETAFIAIHKQTLRALVKQGHQKANLILHLRENPERTLSVIQIGITFVGAFAAAIGGAGAEENIAPWLAQTFKISDFSSEIISVFLLVIPFTYISVVLGELVPKTLALRKPMPVAILAAPWLHLISRLISPIVTIFECSTKKIIELCFKKHATSDESDMHLPSLEETLSPLNKQYVMNMVEVERTLIKEIFTKWSDVIFVNADDSIEEVEKTIILSGHTRIPVLKDGCAIAILHSKEFLAFQKTESTDWHSICRQAVCTQEETPILSALRLLQEKRTHMAIVYSGKLQTGIITMEAIFEEIIGDIYDEDDDGAIEKILSKKKYKRFS